MATSGEDLQVDGYEWERLPDMPTARVDSFGAYNKKKLYVLGGSDEMRQPIRTAEVFKFSSRKWSALPDLPVPRAASNCAVVREKHIIVVGGVTVNQLPLNRVDCFNTKKRKWEEFPPLPIGVVGPYVKLIDDKLYCIAGTDKKDCNQSVVFDFDKRQWLDLPSKPTPCYSCGGYVYNRKIIIVGGRHGKDPVQAVEAFDLDTKQWERLAPMNISQRSFYSVVGIGDEIYVLGGIIAFEGMVKTAERYNIHENAWCRIEDLSEARSAFACGVVGDRVVVACGMGGDSQKPTTQDTGACIEHGGRKFKKLPQASVARSTVSTIVFDGKMAVINGAGYEGPLATVEILKLK